ncbi:MAG TPA: isoprenylcysteine carboxylmethyltransferase family protein [Pseudolabrys sp.]
MSEPRDNAGVIAPPPLIALAAVVLGLALDWLLPAYLLTVLLAFWTRIVIAVVLFGTGGALAFPAMRGFRAAGTHVEPWKPATALVTDGVFGWLRNPMYVGLTLLLAGLSIALASDWMLVMTVVFMPVIHFGVVRREERYLEAKFGDAYRAYKARVPRYGWPG